MDVGISSGHLYVWQKSQILVGNHVPVLISSPAHCLVTGEATSSTLWSFMVHIWAVPSFTLGLSLLLQGGKFPSQRRHQLLEKESRQLSQQ